MRLSILIASLVAFASTAEANKTRLDIVWSGTQGTVVFIHGKANCTESALGSFDSRCGNDARGYWLNSTNDGGDGHDFMDEATARVNADGSVSFWEAIAVRYDGENQGFWSAANDVAACLKDLAAGTNASGCNPSLVHRTQFRIVVHSMGGAIIDRILSSGFWPQLTGTGGAIVGSPVTSAGALAGAKSASALYGIDGASNFCTSLVSFLAGWALKNPGSQSLTRGSVIGEARNGLAGKSPRWVLKITTTGGGGSCNNNFIDSIAESVNDTPLGALCGCVGFSSSDDTDGILWQFDTDPTSNPSASNGGKQRAEYTGLYWHWVASFANHSHNRNDAYVRKYGLQNSSGCFAISPGTCIGQFAW
jgi:hypothetical protein